DTGILLRRVHGDEVEQGEPLVEIHAGSTEAAERAATAFLDAITWSEGPVEPRRLVLGHVGPGRR
ncbi:MAG: pyrimidine-nucleoside phosphorylase, partial [Dehalococcoidia bacterium]